MAGVLSNIGEERMLGLIVNKSGLSLENLILKLFQSNTTPAEGDTAATYTEASFTGYLAVTLVSADWTVTPGAPSSAAAAQKTFTSSANQATQNIYGYYLVTATGNVLVAAERFSDAPNPITNNGDNIKVTITLTQD